MPPRTFRALPSSTRLYLAVIIATGSATILLSLSDLLQGRIDLNWLLLAALTLVSGSATVRLASIPVAISISETFVFTSALLFGASAGTLTVALDAAVISFWSYRRGQAFYKIAFNLCALPLTIWIAAHLFFFRCRNSTPFPKSRTGRSNHADRPAFPLYHCLLRTQQLDRHVRNIARTKGFIAKNMAR